MPPSFVTWPTSRVGRSDSLATRWAVARPRLGDRAAADLGGGDCLRRSTMSRDRPKVGDGTMPVRLIGDGEVRLERRPHRPLTPRRRRGQGPASLDAAVRDIGGHVVDLPTPEFAGQEDHRAETCRRRGPGRSATRVERDRRAPTSPMGSAGRRGSRGSALPPRDFARLVDGAPCRIRGTGPPLGEVQPQSETTVGDLLFRHGPTVTRTASICGFAHWENGRSGARSWMGGVGDVRVWTMWSGSPDAAEWRDRAVKNIDAR